MCGSTCVHKFSSIQTNLVEILFLISEAVLVVVRVVLEKMDLSVEKHVPKGFMVSSVRYMNRNPLQFSLNYL